MFLPQTEINDPRAAASIRGRHVRNLVAFAERHLGWHTAATDRTTQRALAAAVRTGYVRTNAHGQFCFNYPTTN